MPCLCKFKDIHMSCFVALGGNCLVSNFVVLRSVFLLLICIFVSFVLFVQIFFFFRSAFILVCWMVQRGRYGGVVLSDLPLLFGTAPRTNVLVDGRSNKKF